MCKLLNPSPSTSVCVSRGSVGVKHLWMRSSLSIQSFTLCYMEPVRWIGTNWTTRNYWVPVSLSLCLLVCWSVLSHPQLRLSNLLLSNCNSITLTENYKCSLITSSRVVQDLPHQWFWQVRVLLLWRIHIWKDTVNLLSMPPQNAPYFYRGITNPY